MKTNLFIVLLGIGMLAMPKLYAQKDQVKKSDAVMTEKFTVLGNCGMCVTRIEGSLKGVDGVKKASYDLENHEMTVKFDASIISLDDIKMKIADVGHDTKEYKAKDENYNKLHGCCKYERKMDE